MTLRDKQQAFVNEYLIDFNATRAAERAGYSGNDNTLAVTGHDLLRNPKIAEMVQKRLQEKAMSADEVLMRLAEHARGDMGKWLTNDGEIDIATMKEDDATRILRKVKRTYRQGETQAGGTWEETRVEVELHDAQAALVHIGKHHRLFADRSEISGLNGGPIRTETTVNHAIDSDTAETIFDILAASGAIPSASDDAEAE